MTKLNQNGSLQFILNGLFRCTHQQWNSFVDLKLYNVLWCIQGGGYETKKATLRGGWDKCLGPFDHYQAKAFGIDVWDCHNNNCYIRKDYNGGRSSVAYHSHTTYRLHFSYKLGIVEDSGHTHKQHISITLNRETSSKKIRHNQKTNLSNRAFKLQMEYLWFTHFYWHILQARLLTLQFTLLFTGNWISLHVFLLDKIHRAVKRLCVCVCLFAWTYRKEITVFLLVLSIYHFHQMKLIWDK